MQRLLILAMMALLSGCSSTDKLIENLSENVVGIRYQDRGVIDTGGVVLTKKGKVILTNWHVCLPFLMGNVRPGADKFKNLRILKHDSTFESTNSLSFYGNMVPADLIAKFIKGL